MASICRYGLVILCMYKSYTIRIGSVNTADGVSQLGGKTAVITTY